MKLVFAIKRNIEFICFPHLQKLTQRRQFLRKLQILIIFGCIILSIWESLLEGFNISLTLDLPSVKYIPILQWLIKIGRASLLPKHMSWIIRECNIR